MEAPRRASLPWKIALARRTGRFYLGCAFQPARHGFLMTADLVRQNAKRVRDAFAPLIARGLPVALVDFSETPNASDHAIWLGEKRLLEELGAPIVYRCSPQSYDRSAMAAKLGEGLIVLHGGVHSGRKDAAHRSFRWRLLADFPDHRAILMPYQPAREDEEHLKRAGAEFGSRGNLVLFAASENARKTLAFHFGDRVRIELAPDPAFLLPPRNRVAEIAYDLVWIARTDSGNANDTTETAARLASQAAEKFPIPRFGDGADIGYVAKHRPQTILLTDWQAFVFENEAARSALAKLSFDERAEAYVNRAFYLLSLGQVIITDRLHAHIFAMQLDLPHVLLNDGAGRNFAFHDTWTRSHARCRLAANPSEAWTVARQAALALKEMAPKEAQSWTWRDL
jgi:exopolysaccharide biosynthesis predicted pyruvyltransferase EpsI